MKHWQNSWERKLGDRLRNTQAKPEDHVWDLIESELDVASKKRPFYHRYAAALLFLLLIPAGYLGMQRSPTGHATTPFPHFSMDRALNVYAPSEGIVADLETTVVLPDVISPETAFIAPINSNSISATYAEQVANLEAQPVFADIDRPQTSAVLESSITQRTIEQPLELQGIDYEFIATVNAEVESALDAGTYADLIQPYQPSAQRTIVGIGSVESFQLLNVDLIDAALIARADLKPLVYDMQEPEQIAALQTINLNSLILDLPAVNNDILVRHPNTELTAKEMVSQLPIYTKDVTHSSIFSDLIIPEFEMSQQVMTQDVLSIAGDRNFIMQAMLLLPSNLIADINPDLIPAPIDVIEEDNWLTEAQDEFNTWKEAVEGAEEEEELEDLIEEAILDEDDPWTKRQNERQDLFYTYNVNKGFHIGAIAGVQQTWVTRASRNEQIDRSVTEYRFNPGFQAGINVGYDLSNHFGLMAEFKYSDEGGKYYNTKKERIEQMDLKYLEIPVYIKVKHSKLTPKDRPIVFNYLVGMKFSDLRKVSMVSGDEEDRRFGQDYNTSDWGLTAGMDFDLYINKNLFWTVGVRAGISGMGGSSDFQDDVKGPMNIDAGLFTRFSYRIPGKK